MAARPEFFWLLLILVPVVIIMIRRFITGRRHLADLTGRWRDQQYFDLFTVKSFFSFLGFLVFIVFSVLSLVGFPGREIPVNYEPAGTDVIFVVDTSQSMKAGDAEPSRLKAAERIIRSVCENTPGGRFGLIVFKGTGIKIIPATEDVESIYNFLNYLSTDLLTSPGSNIPGGLETALESFPAAEEREKYIFLLTDGEIHEGDVSAVAGAAADKDVSVYCVGIGTAEGERIPLADGGFLKDGAGAVVITKLHEESLRYLAAATGGEYYHYSDGNMLPALLKLASGTAAEDQSRYRIIVKENYRVFLLVALLGILLSKAVKVVRWKREF